MATLSTWPGRSHVSTFVHTLHLLDLDLREDWPDVSVQTFGPKSNLQHRLRCVEWSLYRLFELYDVKATRDKLRPFFPPSTALQSVNLRAALLRQLTDLKKDGALGGSILLRKTMLDECKGDKFEELLAVFSMTVLKRVLAKSSDQPDVTKVSSYNAVPLVLSHRKAIQRDVEKRKELDLRTRQQLRNIDASIHALAEEAVAWRHRKAPAVPKNADALRRLVRENWIGDNEWVETILHGVPPTPGLVYDEPQDEDVDDDASVLLTDLDSRVRAQDLRLTQWQQYMETLQQQHRDETMQDQPNELHQSSATSRFGRHQEIAFDRNAAQIRSSNHSLHPRHGALLQMLDQRSVSKPVETLSSADMQALGISRNNAHVVGKSSTRPSPTPRSSYKVGVDRKGSDASSQDTVVGDSVGGRQGHQKGSAHVPPETHQSHTRGLESPKTTYDRPGLVRTPPELNDYGSLAERTRASLGHFETPRAKLQRSRTTISPARKHEPDPTTASTSSNAQSDRASLLERTRQSMSFLTNVLDDNYQPRTTARSRKARHSKSKSMFIPSQRPRLERAWSEESLASAAKDDSFDVEADYESVFKSRPRLAMSPNLSPARNSDMLDGDLEDALNKLTINSSSPDY